MIKLGIRINNKSYLLGLKIYKIKKLNLVFTGTLI